MEFWFRFRDIPSVNDTFNLHSLSSIGAESQQFSGSLAVIVDKGVLKCLPFGDDNSAEVLEFTGIDVVNERRWQHVSCGVTQQ